MNNTDYSFLIRKQAHLIKQTFGISISDSYEILAIVFYQFPNYKALKQHFKLGNKNQKWINLVDKLIRTTDIHEFNLHVNYFAERLISTIQTNISPKALQRFFNFFFENNIDIKFERQITSENELQIIIPPGKDAWSLEALRDKNLNGLIEILQKNRLSKFQSHYGKRVICKATEELLNGHISLRLIIHGNNGSFSISNLVSSSVAVNGERFIVFSDDLLKLQALVATSDIAKSLRYGRIFHEKEGFSNMLENIDISKELIELPNLDKKYEDAINLIKIPKMGLTDFMSLFT